MICGDTWTHPSLPVLSIKIASSTPGPQYLAIGISALNFNDNDDDDDDNDDDNHYLHVHMG